MAVSVDRFIMMGNAIDTLISELKEVNALRPQAWCLFGSAALYVRDVIDREPGDIDVLVTKRVWGDLLDRPGWTWDTPDAGNPPMLIRPPWQRGAGEYTVDKKICLWFDWRDPWLEIDVEREIKTAEYVEWSEFTLRCTLLENVKRHKLDAIRYPENSKREQHLADIAAIDLFVKECKG